MMDKPDENGKPFPCLSEDWLLHNLPEGWDYDCSFGEQDGFHIYPPRVGLRDSTPLFIPLDLLKRDRSGSH